MELRTLVEDQYQHQRQFQNHHLHSQHHHGETTQLIPSSCYEQQQQWEDNTERLSTQTTESHAISMESTEQRGHSAGMRPLYVLGVPINKLSPMKQFTVCLCGVLIFYLIYGYSQVHQRRRERVVLTGRSM